MDNISEKLNKVSVNVQPDIPVEDIWGKVPDKNSKGAGKVAVDGGI